MAEEEPCGEQACAAHEISPMEDLVDVRDLRGAFRHAAGIRGKYEKVGRPEEEAGEPEAR